MLLSNMKKRKVLKFKVPDMNLICCCISRDGRYIVVGDEDALIMWDADGKELRRFIGHKNAVYCCSSRGLGFTT